ncbi:MAG: type II and III secretion system protein [Gemmatimonadetes bacterium]|jgi:hypothetical protein|nr:type II and III secretion system protein [Gemmatimonadota bacterium]MBT6144379.1 type II and III secretion system protein [Gemmatimonadota bacterium]MBT7859396.1 type II and III secretion system protein [Gemmatimonadota bacterium]
MPRWLLTSMILLLAIASLARTPSAPRRQYVSLAGTVSLSRGMPFYQAMQALSEISARLAQKVIVDDRERTFPIGVEITDMPWRDALDILVKLHGLQSQEFHTYIRVLGADGRGTVKDREKERPHYTSSRREVEISALFFEADRRKLRDHGVNWGAAIKRGTWIQGVEHAIPGQVSVTIQQQQQQQQGASAGGEGGEGEEQLREGLTALIRLLESRSVGNVLASPSIQVLDGDEGRVQVGQDFSVKQIDFAGNVTDNFISTGLILHVSPTVVLEDSLSFIHLSVTAERSSVSPGAVSTIVNKTQASTSLMLLDGERAVIAGLYTTSEIIDRAGIPILKDLPWWFLGIRYLAGTTIRENSQKELIIILRASLVPELAVRRIEASHNLDYLEENRQIMRQRLEESEPSKGQSSR